MHPIENAIDLAGYRPSSCYQNLFPYLQVQPCPDIDAQDKANAFFQVTSACKSTPLYEQLAQLKQSGQRVAMQQAAVDFINSDQFLRSPQSFSATFAQFFTFQLDEQTDGSSIEHFIGQTFQGSDAFHQYIAGDEFQQQLNSAWLAIICLLIELDYQLSWLEQLLQLLTGINFLLHGNAYLNQQGQSQNPIPPPLLNQWLNANFLLPEDIFPMPPAVPTQHLDTDSQTASHNAQAVDEGTSKVNKPTHTDKLSSINSVPARSYALGTLHLVEYRLAGYQLGELQKVENILYGETRRASSRYLSQSEQQQDKAEQHNADTDFNQQSSDKDFSDAVQKTLHDRTTATQIKNYETDYAPTSPNATTNGQWTISESPKGGFNNNQMQFAKDIVQQASNKIVAQIKQDRRHLVSEHRELSYLSEFQNQQKEENVTGFYHWLNKQYDVRAFDTDKRLLLELTFDVPKSEIMTLLDLQQPSGLESQFNQAPPLSLDAYGIAHYSDIAAEPITDQPVATVDPTITASEHQPDTSTPAVSPSGNGDSAGNIFYLDACQQFDVAEITPPPPPQRIICQSIKGEQSQASSLITIPDGYYAEQVDIVFSGTVQSVPLAYSSEVDNGTADSSNQTSSNIQLLIGNQSIAAQPGSQSVQLQGQLQGQVPVAIVVTGNAPLNGSYGVTLSIQAKRSPTALNQWQYQIYTAVQNGYQQQKKLYLQQRQQQKQRLESQDTPVTQTLINRQIALQSMKALYQQAISKVGADPAAPHSELPYRQYFEQSLEWDYLYCKLVYNDTDSEHSISTLPILAELDSQIYLKRFLMASQLKVLIPVRRDYVQAVLYFLDCGRIWHGKNHLTPTNPTSTSICNDFKKLRNQYGKQETGNWQVTLPTNMVVLNRSSDLSDINSAIRNLNDAN